MYASQFFENRIINIMRGTAAAAVSSRYLALFTSDPGNDGTEGTEASYTGYARKAITFAAPETTTDSLILSNSAAIIFPNSSGVTQTITHVAVFTATTGGNMLLYGPLTVPIDNEGGIKFEIGSVSWNMSGCLSTYYRTAIANTLRGTACAKFSPYAALFDGDPRKGGTEVSGGAYARRALTMAAPETINNRAYTYPTATITFPTPTAAWGNITHVAIMSAASSGNIFAVFSLGETVTVLTDDVVTIPGGGDSMKLYIG